MGLTLMHETKGDIEMENFACETEKYVISSRLNIDPLALDTQSLMAIHFVNFL